MITLVALAPDGSSQRLRFPPAAEAEAEAAADRLRATGHSLSWLAWSERPSGAPSPSRRTEMRRRLMPLVHHARRTIRHRREGHPFATDAVLAGLIGELAAAYLAARSDRVARLLKVELDRLETLL